MDSNNLAYKDEIYEVIEKTGITDGAIKKKRRLEFKDLMKFRIDKILLVCSLYDYFTLVEDGHLQEAIFNEYLEMNLHYAPNIKRAYSAELAMKALEEDDYGLIITTLRIGDVSISEFGKKVKKAKPDTPLVLLSSNSRELQLLIDSGKLDAVDKVFIWGGDRKIFLAIIKTFEDLVNAPHDCLEFGVTSMLLVEDSPSFYSSYLPQIFTEVMKQSQKLIEEGKNPAEKLLKQRARPKVLHAVNYEDAMDIVRKYKNSLLGVITDMKFKKGGKTDEIAGVKLIEEVRKEIPHLPLLLQSSNSDKKYLASENNVSFLDKNSRTLLHELSEFMKYNFGFGDFIFRMPDGSEVHRARNLRELRDRIKYIPNESLLYHASHNHFSYWLIARTHFELANELKPVRASQFENIRDLRQLLVSTINRYIEADKRGIISIFTRGDYEAENVFQLIGEGSLGGKARGLGFIDRLLKNYLSPAHFENINISIPRTIVLGTNVFDRFMEMNNLYRVAMKNIPDDKLLYEFLKADIPPTVLGDIREILKKTKYPLAVRSSSLLEDAIYQPFAGVYATVMIPNSNPNVEIRFQNLVQAIKYVYASTFMKNAKNYIEATGNRIEEEKMAVILQEMAGKKHGHYFYPTFSGVGRSYNYYPFSKAKPKDGIVNLALGLGKTIVDGGRSLQYSPEYPEVFPQFGTRKDLFAKSQVKFWALDLNSDIIRKIPNEDMHLKRLDISDAEKHGTLKYIASTYSPENDFLYEGITRDGPRVLNFAPLLKSKVIPLNKILKLLLRMSEVSMNCPVEIEFAAFMGEDEPTPVDFRFLQVRPMVKPESDVDIDIDTVPQGDLILKSGSALGNGSYELNYILFVKPETFNASKTREIGYEINKLNRKLLSERKQYMLAGPGRWGSSDPWLGIPCEFSNLNGAAVIVETPMQHMSVDPSQGSHFFQNMTSFKIAYITISDRKKDDFIDWAWLDRQVAEEETKFVKLVRANEGFKVYVDGQSGKSVAIKNNGG